MKKAFILLAMVFLASQSVMAIELEIPEIHGEVVIEFLDFAEDSAYNSSMQYQEVYDRYNMRSGTISICGGLSDYVDYEAEFGVSSCAGSGIMKIKEAGIYFKPRANDMIRIGFGQLHVRRGFELGEECTGLLSAEKPRWKKAINTACHPLGGVIELDIDFGEISGIDIQIVYANGSNETLRDEHDFNIGCFMHTPLEGFSVGGFYNTLEMEINSGNEDPEKAERLGFGYNYDAHNIITRGEYFILTGLMPGLIPSGIMENPEDIENIAFFLQGGYKFELNSEIIPNIQPYIQYQSWNRFSNEDETGDFKYAWFTGGARISLGTQNSYLRIDYQIPSSTPDNAPEDSDKLIIRLGSQF